MGWNYSVSFLVPLVMFGWVPLTVALFQSYPGRKAVLISAIGGFLFLPVATFSAPGVPDLGKIAFISISILAGKTFSSTSSRDAPEWGWYDLPVALWCFFVPVATSLSNGLGLYDGVSGVLSNLLTWGILYWAGRTYFAETSSLRELCVALAIGGLLYIPFILFELRMAPTLSQRVYGFFPHSFSQHVRYGGYRPIVFMPHGLIVSQFMSVSATVAYWLWRTRAVTHVLRVPVSVATIALFVATALCKSANGWILLAVGIASYSLFRATPRLFAYAVLLVPAYILVRLLNVIAVEDIQDVARVFFDEERVLSLTVRLLQERAFGDRALIRPLFGWGGYRRGWPVDPYTGQETVRAVDAAWVILFSTYGIVGLISAFAPFWLAAWHSFRANSKTGGDREKVEAHSRVGPDRAILSMAVLMFAVDSLINAPTPAVYILLAGALIGVHASGTAGPRRTKDKRSAHGRSRTPSHARH